MWRQTLKSRRLVGLGLKDRLEYRALKVLLVLTVKLAKRAPTARLARRAAQDLLGRAAPLVEKVVKARQDRME